MLLTQSGLYPATEAEAVRLGTRAYVRVYRGAGAVVAVASELPDNDGPTITDCASALAGHVWLAQGRPATFAWIEQINAGHPTAEWFRHVRFAGAPWPRGAGPLPGPCGGGDPGAFSAPVWTTVAAATVAALLAGPGSAADLTPWQSLPGPP